MENVLIAALFGFLAGAILRDVVVLFRREDNLDEMIWLPADEDRNIV